ncbi:MAG TPA: HAD family hydrolase [Methylibium sp.]|uniref:HAD family hydrolase n=1 Tax=Methylibium sp. TaxID=2067992 RepID=UPI002DBB6856|nr:HAD family hydrolase [Methylibium sp.]HEU4459359.1 HAD family hydrolase [Methylibium sp.]
MNLCLFDLDLTLLPIDSDHAWGDFVVTLGWARAEAQRAENDRFYAQYQDGTLDIAAYVEFATRAWRDRPAAEQQAGRDRFMREAIAPHLRSEAFELVRRHQRDDDFVAIVTATNEWVTRPIAEAFGIETLIAVELERSAAGQVTGRIRGVPSFREGKVERVAQWLAGRGRRVQDFERVSVYSDSINDLPLLELATHPVATNPSPPLAALAGERGWPILNLFA